MCYYYFHVAHLSHSIPACRPIINSISNMCECIKYLDFDLKRGTFCSECGIFNTCLYALFCPSTCLRDRGYIFDKAYIFVYLNILMT